jgi:hypothetical protein
MLMIIYFMNAAFAGATSFHQRGYLNRASWNESLSSLNLKFPA